MPYRTAQANAHLPCLPTRRLSCSEACRGEHFFQHRLECQKRRVRAAGWTVSGKSGGAEPAALE